MAYALVAKWTARPGEEAAVAASLAALTEATQAEPGNLVYQPHTQRDNPRVFMIYEQYIDEAAFQAHIDSEHFAIHALRDAIPRLEARERTFYESWPGTTSPDS
jgi:quinol monooxygenase YgiN